MNKVIIPQWIACRSYLTETDESRTIVSNQKTHKTIALDGLASDLYAFISSFDEGVTKDVLNQYAVKKGIDDELESFLNQLNTMKFISFDNEETNDDFISTPLQYRTDEDKKITAIEDDFSKWAYSKGFLWGLFFEMTYKCNLRCIHCYNPAFRGKEEISFEKAKEIIDDAVNLGCYELTVSGGECTLDSDFLKIIKYARSKRMSLKIFSNGLEFYNHPDLLKEVISLYPYQIGISIYSSRKDQHETVTTVPGSWEKSMTVIKKLQEYGVNAQIKSVQLAETVSSWKDTIALCRKYDTAAAFDITLTPTIEKDKKTWNHFISDDYIRELCKDPDSPLYVGNWEEPPEIDIHRDGPCYAGFHCLVINPHLDVTGCVSLPLKFGSLKTERLKDIWENGLKNKESILYKWQHVTLDAFKDCFKEDYCRFCHFCPGMGMLEDKLFSKSELLCKIAKIKHDVYYELKGNKSK